MASLNYNSMLTDVVTGNIDFDTNSFKVMLVGSGYTPDQDTHSKRSQVTNEITNAAGSAYTSGGAATTVSVSQDNTNNRAEVTFSAVSWSSASFTARAAVIYKNTGTASTDNLVAYVDFGSDTTASNGTFQVQFSTPLRFSN
jgi:hypothetical protein